LAIAEEVLNTDPENTGAHKIVVEAATALELPRTKVLSLDILFKNHPKDKAIAVQLANALADIGEVQRAERTLSDLLRTTPTDGDLAQALKNISARRTMKEAGYGALASGEGSYRDILKDEKESVSLEQEKRVQKRGHHRAPHRRIRIRLRPAGQPQTRPLPRRACTQKKQFDRALALYER
jgi:predicted Zn-dependent protease